MSSLVYDGTAGIGIFLARLSRLTNDPIIRMTAEGALAQALTAVDSIAEAGDYGFYAGLSGIAWSCVEAGMAINSDELGARGRAAFRRAAELAPHQHRLDIINGSAGVVLALLAAAEHDPLGLLVEAAERHGEHLVKLAAHTDSGWSWDTLGMPNERHLLGFAHGVSGIAYALAALGVATGRAHYVAAAKEGLRYERGYFRPAEDNWPDLRSFTPAGPTGEPPCMLAWCHGAPGIGLSRVALQGLLPGDPSTLAEAEAAIRTTSSTLGRAGLGIGNFSLCHGDGGNADLLLLGADVLERPALRQAAEAAGARALDRYEYAGLPWPCGVVSAGETPNLLLGLAGIGYFFLRLYDSRDIPTVLLPAATSSRRA